MHAPDGIVREQNGQVIRGFRVPLNGEHFQARVHQEQVLVQVDCPAAEVVGRAREVD